MFQNRYNIKIAKLACGHNPQLLVSFNCSTTQPANDFSVDLNIKPSLMVQTLSVRSVFFFSYTLWKMRRSMCIFQVKVTVYHPANKNGKGKIFFGMSNITIDLCRFFNGKITSNLMEIIAGDLRKCSNGYHPCPYEVYCCIMLTLFRRLNHFFFRIFVKGHIYMKKCKIYDDSTFPPIVPSGIYVAHSYFYSKLSVKESYVFHIIFFLDVSPKSYRM